jgi:hypothetical protein
MIILTTSVLTTAQKWNKIYSDTTVSMIDSVRVGGKKYLAFYREEHFFLLNEKADTIIKREGYYSNYEFKDFNGDFYKDLLLYQSTNTPGMMNLFIYVPSTKKFRRVKNSDEFPAPEKIPGTKCYYSYHKSGCADENWDSDLFFIQGFKAVKIGNISGIGCGDKDGIYISKVRGNRESLIKTLPIKTIENYKEYKWGFIRNYWAKYYKAFL